MEEKFVWCSLFIYSLVKVHRGTLEESENYKGLIFPPKTFIWSFDNELDIGSRLNVCYTFMLFDTSMEMEMKYKI